jgi:type 1 glutamine amidotransferase
MPFIRLLLAVLLSTTTDPKKPQSEYWVGPRRTEFQRFVRSGGGIVAIHAAADSHYHWPWYGRLIGGRFQRHPEGTPTGRVTLANPGHRANRGLPAAVTRTDEWYYFDDFDPTSTLLMTLDPASIGEKDINSNPIAWTRTVDGGRVFYTALGHTTQSYSEPFFLRHVANGLDWVLAARRPAR